MEVILSTAFGVKAETQTVENDPITELAKKAMGPHPIIAIMCNKELLFFVLLMLQGMFVIIILKHFYTRHQ